MNYSNAVETLCEQDTSSLALTCTLGFLFLSPDPCLVMCPGTTVKVTTVDGLVDLKVPGGTQPGTTLVMSKRGVPRLGASDSRGDHQVPPPLLYYLSGHLHALHASSVSCSLLEAQSCELITQWGTDIGTGMGTPVYSRQ